LQRRLVGRGSETQAERDSRLANAARELEAAAEFDYIVINDRFDQAVSTLHGVVSAERVRRQRIADLNQHIDALRREIENLSRKE
jgi:guanylate kinase